MDDIKIVLLCGDTPSRKAYLDEIEKHGIMPDVVADFGELRDILAKSRYHGILIDLVTGMRSPKSDKQFVYKVIEKFPVTQLQWDSSRNMIRTLYYGHSKSQGTLSDFILKECAVFKARMIRNLVRKKIVFSILTSKKPEADGDLQNSFTKTITYDVSERGCFIYSTADWCTGDSVWIFVKGLKDRSLIKGIVRRVVPWGTYMKVPGIGIEVDTINPGQQEEISRFIADFRDD